MEYTWKIIQFWLTPFILIASLILIVTLGYSFIYWDWTLITSPEYWLNLNPLAHTWSRACILIWTIIVLYLAWVFDAIS